MAGGGYRHSTILQDTEAVNVKTGLAQIEHMKMLRRLASGSIVRLVSNCEDVADWDISDSANFSAVDETTDKRVGSNSIELVDAGTTKGTYVTLDNEHKPNREDWSDFSWLCMWIHDDTGLRLADELKIQISNNGDWSAEVSVPVCQTADLFEYKCIDISALDRGSVDGFRFVNRRGTGSSEKVYVDEIIVTDMITGVGDGTQACTGPVKGPCIILPVADGQTINPGEFVNFEAGEAHAGVQNDQAVIGVAVQYTPTTSTVGADATPKEVLVATEPAIVIARNDATGAALSDAVMIASGNITMDEAVAAREKYIAIALETATANADTWFQLHNRSVVA